MLSLPPSETCVENGRKQVTIRDLETIEAYDLWSEVYDTDGNFLQALDTIELQSLLPLMLSKVTTPTPWKLVDLGCGTGRNTSRLIDVPDATVIGLDASPKMLDMARSKLIRGKSQGRTKIKLELYDMLNDTTPPTYALNVDALISTLVMEHVPLVAFFSAVSQILKPGGVAIVTNLHSEMRNISQAGFVDPMTGDKIRPPSHSHLLSDVIAEARVHGMDVVGDILEKSVDAEMSKCLGPRAKKWIGVTVWFGVMFRKNR